MLSQPNSKDNEQMINRIPTEKYPINRNLVFIIPVTFFISVFVHSLRYNNGNLFSEDSFFIINLVIMHMRCFLDIIFGRWLGDGGAFGGCGSFWIDCLA